MTEQETNTPPTLSIDAKLGRIMAEVGYVQKDKKNPHFKYRYASAEAVLQKINAGLVREGIGIDHKTEVRHFEERGNAMDALVQIEIRLHDPESGEFRLFSGPGQGRDSGDKAVAKAVTMAHKYAYAVGFCISWGDDPEADAATDGPKKSRSRKTAEGAPAEELLTLIGAAVDAATLAEVREKILVSDLQGSEATDVSTAYRSRRSALKNNGKETRTR